MKKIFISVFIILFLGFVALYLIGSQGNHPKNLLFQVKSYETRDYKPSDTLVVMTYNIGYLSGMTNNLPVERTSELFESNSAKAIALINQIRPDIIGFQEIDFGSARSYGQHQLDTLAIRTGFSYAYQSINWDKKYVPFPYWPVSRHFGRMLSGQAILSALPIRNDSTVVLIKPENTSFLYDAFYLERLVQMCDVDAEGVLIKVINLHLEAFHEETRVRQAQVVKALFETYAERMPVLMIGDFNSRPPSEVENSGAMKVIMGSKHIASAVSPSAYGQHSTAYFTFSSGEPDQMIDYILYNQNFIDMVETRVVTEAGDISDHFPLMMKFTVKAETDSK